MDKKNTKVQYPRRTERTHQIRADLIAAAATCFSRKGYNHTKLTEIALTADVHIQTLYRHFKSKEELAVAAAEQVLIDCRTYFEMAPKGQNAFQTWRGWIYKTVSYLSSEGFGTQKKKQLLASSSLINDSYIAIIYSGYENLLTDYLSRDFNMDSKTSRLPRLAACALWSGNEAALKRCAGLDGTKDNLANQNFVLQESLGVVDEIHNIFGLYLTTMRP